MGKDTLPSKEFHMITEFEKNACMLVYNIIELYDTKAKRGN